MTQLTGGGVRHEVDRALRQASPFVEHYARFGYAAKGFVYCIVGALAAMAAFGAGGQTTGSEGALHTILRQPFGKVLLGVVGVGLAGYALWQFIRAVEDPEHAGSDAKGIFKRIGFFISGVIHVGLVVAAVQLLLGSGGGGDESGDSGAQGWTATLMSYPFGQFLVAGAGIGIVIYGLFNLYRAYKADLDKMLALGQMGATAHRWVILISRFGIAARGVVFGLIGWFLIAAAMHANASEAKGVGGALRYLEGQPYGPWLLGFVALGLIAYGVYEFVRARYRRIDPT